MMENNYEYVLTKVMVYTGRALSCSQLGFRCSRLILFWMTVSGTNQS